MMKLERSFFLGILFSIPATLVAQSQLTSTGPIPFALFDTDKNGFISQQEFVSTHTKRRAKQVQTGYPMGRVEKRFFRDFDSNGDGQLSEKELLAGQHRNRIMRGGGQGGTGMGMGGHNMPKFSEFDENGDGVLMKEEFQQARAKRISERARQGYMMRNLANAPSFETIDSNSNGEISPDEFYAAQMAHRQQLKR
jgi:Ca2+-binding EF-hand superfamily protein